MPLQSKVGGREKRWINKEARSPSRKEDYGQEQDSDEEQEDQHPAVAACIHKRLVSDPVEETRNPTPRVDDYGVPKPKSSTIQEQSVCSQSSQSLGGHD